MSTNTFYLTTPIYYVNAEPHLGHAYTTIVADVATRFHRLLGWEVRFQTGTDEHGDKIAEAAAKNHEAPKTFTDRISAMFRTAWPNLNIEYDRFIRTTDPDHVKTVQNILQQVYDSGDIYFAKYGGNYCVGCERFLTDRELLEGKCPDHGTKPVYREEENYFFRMSKYQDRLKEHIAENPDFIRPERYKNEVKSFLSEPLEDLCISRPKSRLTWGITLPFDEKFVTYVWFDALINYLTGLAWPSGELYEKFWPATQHLIAKDILKPHGIYWPTMLMAAGIPLYQHLNVHGYWNVAQAKMSKSLGNVVRPLDLAGVYGADAFRYFLMREMNFGLDANFSEELLVERYNADLANDLGNLFSRVINMLHKYRNGVVPAEPQGLKPAPQPGQAPAAATGVHSAIAHEHCLAWETAQAYQSEMEGFHFHLALAWVWDLISAANKYVVAKEPWTLAKDPARSAELDVVLSRLCQALADVAVMIWPVMPQIAQAMAGHLGLGEIKPGLLTKIKAAEPLIPPGTQTALPGPLFPRIDTDKVQAKTQKAEAKAAQKGGEKTPPKPREKQDSPADGLISIEEFGRLELRLGRVLSAEPVPGADKLLKLTVDLGEKDPRQIVAGIARHYQPDEVVGRQVVVVSNLKPAKLRGVMSQGMLLAAVSEEKVRLVAPDLDLPPGSKVR